MSTFLHLFGCPDVEHDGLVTPLVPERRNQLLARLAIERTWIDRSELAVLLWPERDPKLAQANLRKALHFARALPWTGALDAQGSVMRFAVNTDVHDFEVAADAGRTADALGLYRGELLDGLDELSLRVEQGYEIRRPSMVMLQARSAGSREIRVGGNVVPIAHGESL